MTFDFITISNIIFKDKDKYKYITDEDKETNFFILNRKFAFYDLKKAQFFNYKEIDKASALDVWFNIFYKKTNNTPGWWWKSKAKSEKDNKKFKKEDLEDLKIRYNLTDRDIKFLISYFEEDVKDRIKKLKKFEKLNGENK